MLLLKLRASPASVRARGQALPLPGGCCKQPRLGLALGVPHCPTNGLRTGRRDAPLLRGSARNRDGPPESLHHQGDALLGLRLAVRARYLPEQVARLVEPSIQNGGQLLVPAERSRQGQRNRRAGVPAGGGTGGRRIHEWALIHAAVICLALCQTNARDLELGLASDPTEDDRRPRHALEGARVLGTSKLLKCSKSASATLSLLPFCVETMATGPVKGMMP